MKKCRYLQSDHHSVLWITQMHNVNIYSVEKRLVQLSKTPSICFWFRLAICRAFYISLTIFGWYFDAMACNASFHTSYHNIVLSESDEERWCSWKSVILVLWGTWQTWRTATCNNVCLDVTSNFLMFCFFHAIVNMLMFLPSALKLVKFICLE